MHRVPVVAGRRLQAQYGHFHRSPTMHADARGPRATFLQFGLACVAALTIVISPAQAATTGSGKPATETRNVSDFEAIALSGAMDLVVRQGSKEAVEVTADDNLLPLLETVVESGSNGRTLHVRFKRGERVNTKGPIKVNVNVVKLSGLSAAGSGDIRVEGLKTPLLKLSVSGSSDARLNELTTDALEVRIAGSGDVQANGAAKALKVSIAGSGDVQMSALAADDVTVSIAGSGDAVVQANKSLGVSIAGSGDVQYSGTATAVRSSVAGSGQVTKK